MSDIKSGTDTGELGELENVTPISQGRRGRKPKDPTAEGRKAKTPPAIIYRAIMLAMNDDPAARQMPAFKRKFLVMVTASGDRVPLERKEGDEVSIVKEDVIVSAILGYSQDQLAGLDDYQLTEGGARECMRYWFFSTATIEEPAMVHWQGEHGLCFRRLPWERRVDPFACPTWDKFLERLSNRQAFMDWLGSLFMPDSYMQQYVWISGMGEDGKGVINRFLSKVFYGAYYSSQPPSRDDKFWTHAIMGKRLVVFPDCNNKGFVTSGLFKSLTGGDPITVEPKFRQPFTYTPKAKYLFFSNERPSISSERADTRRLILCGFDPNASKIDSDDFEGDLWREGGVFLTNAIHGYAGRYMGRQVPIAVDPEPVRDLIASNEETLQVFFDEFFVMDKAGRVAPADMQAKLRVRFPHRSQHSEFISWLERHEIRKVKIRDGDVTPWFYRGIRCKDAPSG
jgi:hypothetical protein